MISTWRMAEKRIRLLPVLTLRPPRLRETISSARLS
jgi:hypothetical protein